MKNGKDLRVFVIAGFALLIKADYSIFAVIAVFLLYVLNVLGNILAMFSGKE